MSIPGLFSSRRGGGLESGPGEGSMIRIKKKWREDIWKERSATKNPSGEREREKKLGVSTFPTGFDGFFAPLRGAADSTTGNTFFKYSGFYLGQIPIGGGREKYSWMLPSFFSSTGREPDGDGPYLNRPLCQLARGYIACPSSPTQSPRSYPIPPRD